MGFNLSPLRLADQSSQRTKCGDNNLEHWSARCVDIPHGQCDMVQRTFAEEGHSNSKVNIAPRLRWCSCIYDSVRCSRTRRANSAFLRSGCWSDDFTNGCSRKHGSSIRSVINHVCQAIFLFQVEVKHSLLVFPRPRTDRSRTSRCLFRKSSWRSYLMDREDCNVPRRSLLPQSSPHSLQRNGLTLSHVLELRLFRPLILALFCCDHNHSVSVGLDALSSSASLFEILEVLSVLGFGEVWNNRSGF